MMHPTKVIALLTALLGMAAAVSSAAPAEPRVAADLPIKEVTVFKDGHAFVLHEGKAATDAAGRVVLDYLPAPVLGTFWPYSADPKVKLTTVTAGRRLTTVKRTALAIPELLEGNVGAKVRIREAAKGEKNPPEVYEAVILGIPTRTSEELSRTSPPGTEERLPQKGGIVLLKTTEGTRAVPIANIDEVTFLDGPAPDVAAEEFRNLLTLQFDWAGRKPPETAAVGMMYVQRGIRWISNYRVEIDGKGKARIKLQATLLNELADLKDVKAHLVIGVPTFAFKDTVDPISLQQAVAQLSSHFQPEARTANAFSNSIMTQRLDNRNSDSLGRADEALAARVMDLGPEIAVGRKTEDLFVFTVDHITLKKGERMVVPVAEYELAYKDIYRLDLPFGPPPEARQHFNSDQQLELARLMASPKAMHNLRLTNKSEHPLTTAPAMIFRDGKVLAQGMMKYTAIGAIGNLEVTTAVDIAVEKKDKETGRTPNAANWHNQKFDRINLAGTVHLVNHRDQAVEVEVTRHILGILDGAGQDGAVEQISWAEGGWANADGLPSWWAWHSWAPWWYEFNGIGRITWKVKIEPGKSIDLDYTWHYLWG
ncbi:MAG: hypothetical protein NTY65_13375 [Planctomycetota bacterium]|nr:hypothetical protein [Planctomycetota bacterium]